MKYTDEELIAYLEGDLDPVRRKEIQVWVSQSAESKQRIDELSRLCHLIANTLEYSPSKELEYEFKAALEQEKSTQKKNTYWLQLAAAVALLMIGFISGKLIFQDSVSTNQMSQLENEVQNLQQLVMMTTLRQHSASERIQVVGLIENNTSGLNGELIQTLVTTLNTDPSPNVRYSAVQALSVYIDIPDVRQQLVRSLQHQTDPLIQIALIGLFVEVDEKSAISPLKKIIENDLSNEDVKQQAEVALQILI